MNSRTKDFLRGEFIGKGIEVTKSENPALLGLKGTIVDETKNMITIEDENNRKLKIIKSLVTLKFDDGFELNGQNIQKRTEERIKSK